MENTKALTDLVRSVHENISKFDTIQLNYIAHIAEVELYGRASPSEFEEDFYYPPEEQDEDEQ